MQRIALVFLGSLGTATVCLAQDTVRMYQVVQSYVSSGTFAGSVVVARGSDVIVSKAYGLAPERRHHAPLVSCNALL
jgi:hypothetical protein